MIEYDGRADSRDNYALYLQEMRRRIVAKRIEHIGDATLYLGDCLEILPTLGKVDAVVTDPPYGVGMNYGGAYDDADVASYKRIVGDACRIAIGVSDFAAITFGSKHQSYWHAHLPPRWTMAWHKPNQCSASPLNGFSAWEPIFLYGKHRKPIAHDVFVHSIQTAQSDTGDHPCPKDIGAWTRLVNMLTQQTDTILDPFMGSGTTGVACAKLGRRFIGIEIEEKYFQIACKRIEEAYKQPDMFIEPPAKPKQEAML